MSKTNAALIDELNQRRASLHQGGGEARLEKQRSQGKMTARERVDGLLDEDTFQEAGLWAEHRQRDFGMDGRVLPADGVVTGLGQIDGRFVYLASQDFTVAGGAAGEVHCDKIVDSMQSALKSGCPFVMINDSGGARVQEGVDSLAGYGRVFYHNTILSGVVPQIAMVAGPCAGGAAYSPALMDFVIQTKKAQMFITGPGVIKQVTGEDVTPGELGGPGPQMSRAGNSHLIAEDDEEALFLCRRLLSFLPANNLEDPPRLPHDGEAEPVPALNDIVPVDPKQSYDIRDVIEAIFDGGDFLELQPLFARNIVIGFARLHGRPVGVIANQPSVMAGALDIDASDKSARFIRFCNAFNVPIVTLVDVPGFMPGVQQEYGGIIRHGAKMLFTYSAATVPKLTVVLRKAYGGAYLAMCSRDLGADRVIAWPTAEIAVMGAEGAVEVVFRKEIAAADDPAAKRAELIESYRKRWGGPYAAASRRQLDEIVEPADTRRYLAQALEVLHSKRELRPAKKHGLIPL